MERNNVLILDGMENNHFKRKETCYSLKVPKEFYDWIYELSIQIKDEYGLTKENRTLTLRLLAQYGRERIIFKNRKLDTKIF